MSLQERLQAMELLWQSLARVPESVSSPEWHGEVVAARLTKVKEGKAKFLTLTQVKKRLAKRRP